MSTSKYTKQKPIPRQQPVPGNIVTPLVAGATEQKLIGRIQKKMEVREAKGHPLALSDLLFSDEVEEVTPAILDGAVAVSMAHGADPIWDHAQADYIRASPAFMAQELLTGPPGPPYNGRFSVDTHHMEWDKLVVREKRLCVLAPRDHSKTYFFDFAYPIHQIITKPNESGFIFSATQPQAERILGDIKLEIETNPKLKHLVPDKQKQWASRQIRCSNGHAIFARGFGTKVRGAHPVWIVVDDGLNDETVYSELVRNKQIEYFYTAISNMIIPGGQIIVVGTPFHAADLYASLKANTSYHYAEFPAESNPGGKDNKALWPERYNLEALAAKKEEIKTIRYGREFLCQPVSDEMSLFPLHLFKGDPVEQFSVKLGMPKTFWNDMGVEIFMGGDFAMSSSVQADYTVVFTLGLDMHGNRWVIDIKREKGMPYQEQLSLINSVGRTYDPGLIFLEDNQMQRIFGDELIRKTDLPIRKFTTGVQKNSLEKGVPSLRTLLENKKIRIPRGDAHSVEMTDLWIEEMRSFTWQDGKLQGVGSHDDLVMAFWIADQAVRQGGFQFSFGNEATYQNVSAEDADLALRELTGEVIPESSEGQNSGVVETNIGVQQGYVPEGCQMAGPLVVALVNSGQDPCEGCNLRNAMCQAEDVVEPNAEQTVSLF